jgi:hypothetical protein
MGQMLFVTNRDVAASCPRRSIIWRPGGVASCDIVTTWGEVESAIAAAGGGIEVQVDTSIAAATIPSSADVDCFGNVFFVGFKFIVGPTTVVTVADGGRLRNLGGLTNLELRGAPTVRSFVQQNISGNALLMFEGGVIGLEAGATVEAIHFNADFTGAVLLLGSRIENNAGNIALSSCLIASGKTIIHAIFAQLGSGAPPNYPANLFTGDGTTALFQLFDASGTPVPQLNFAGAAVPGGAADYAAGMGYQDGVTTPTLGASTVQAALDILKRRSTGAGPTASRPAIPGDIDTGGTYFDTDLGIPIWSNGAIYIDSTGAPV